MRLTVLSALLACGLALSATSPAGATDRSGSTTRATLPPTAAERALEAAEAALAGTDARDPRATGQSTAGSGPDGSVSLALRDLLLARTSLRGTDARRADSLLARPTDGAADPYGDGYRTRAQRVCNRRLCVHFVRSGADAASRRWARRTLGVMDEAWSHHVGRLGYRRPLRDRRRGGDRRFDVYLKDVGSKGYYGYCAAEQRPTRAKLASGFCVLDDDFSRRQFGRAPWQSMRVTAAHEFFHAIHYAYDFREDEWLLEATATWIEERFADGIDDNRQYLPHGQLLAPGRPLDSRGDAAYGNWLFFEHLTQRYGVGAVRQVWNRAADFRGAPDMTSLGALRDFVGERDDFASHFAGYAGGNTAPASSYPEGRHYPVPAVTPLGLVLGSGRATVTLDHLAAAHLEVAREGLTPSDATLEVAVTGPTGPTAAVAVLVHYADGSEPERRSQPLGSDGQTTFLDLPFGDGVERVTVTPANAALGGGGRTFTVTATQRSS